MTGRLCIGARWVVDGQSGRPLADGVVVVECGRISQVRPRQPDDAACDLDFTRGSVLPGFIDVHAHFTFGTGSRSYETVMAEDSDDEMVARGLENAAAHLRTGVTLARDAGARGDTAFRLREAVSRRRPPQLDLRVSGPPITRTGGHFWFCGGEADGQTGVERRARELIDRGADFLKIMVSGGGTVGTDPSHEQYSAAEVRQAVEVAHDAGKRIIAHCLSAGSVTIALDAGVDEIEHINFIHPDGRREMPAQLARRIVDMGVVVCPTIQTGYRHLEALRASAEADRPSTARIRDLERKLETKLSFVRRLHRAGAVIAAGTDAIEEFGDYALGLRLLVEAGLSPLDAVRAATAVAARAVGVDAEVGTLEPGKRADLIVVDGDISSDIGAAARPLLVLREGRPVA